MYNMYITEPSIQIFVIELSIMNQSLPFVEVLKRDIH